MRGHGVRVLRPGLAMVSESAVRGRRPRILCTGTKPHPTVGAQTHSAQILRAHPTLVPDPAVRGSSTCRSEDRTKHWSQIPQFADTLRADSETRPHAGLRIRSPRPRADPAHEPETSSQSRRSQTHSAQILRPDRHWAQIPQPADTLCADPGTRPHAGLRFCSPPAHLVQILGPDLTLVPGSAVGSCGRCRF